MRCLGRTRGDTLIVPYECTMGAASYYINTHRGMIRIHNACNAP